MIVSNNKEVGRVYRGTKQVKRFYKGEDIINDSVFNYKNFTTNTCDINGFISNKIPKKLHIPDKICVMDASKTAKTYKIDGISFNSAEGIESVFLGSNADGESELINSFGGDGFRGCSTLKMVYIGNSVKSIDNMFNECKNLNGVRVGKNLNEIGGFANCSNLLGVIPYQDTVNVTAICHQAFYQCEKLKNIRILEKVESVDSEAFYECRSLEKLDFQTEVFLGKTAFEKCVNLREISFSGGLKPDSDIWFKDCKALTTINYKGSKKSWENFQKKDLWDFNTGDYTVYCCEFNPEPFKIQTYLNLYKCYAYGWEPSFGYKEVLDWRGGDNVDVIFNGVTYKRTVILLDFNYVVGNQHIYDSSKIDTGEPFIILNHRDFVSGTDYGATIMTDKVYESATLKIINKIKKPKE